MCVQLLSLRNRRSARWVMCVSESHSTGGGSPAGRGYDDVIDDVIPTTGQEMQGNSTVIQCRLAECGDEVGEEEEFRGQQQTVGGD